MMTGGVMAAGIGVIMVPTMANGRAITGVITTMGAIITGIITPSISASIMGLPMRPPPSILFPSIQHPDIIRAVIPVMAQPFWARFSAVDWAVSPVPM